MGISGHAGLDGAGRATSRRAMLARTVTAMAGTAAAATARPASAPPLRMPRPVLRTASPRLPFRQPQRGQFHDYLYVAGGCFGSGVDAHDRLTAGGLLVSLHVSKR